MKDKEGGQLKSNNRINYGLFYTPRKYVILAKSWIDKYISKFMEDTFMLDTSAGEGAFFEILPYFPNTYFVAADIDKEAIEKLRKKFPSVRVYNCNSLTNIERSFYDIKECDKLLIVGNPPYNDRTSQYKGGIKKEQKIEIDKSVRARDLGLSFLLSYNKLKADYVLVLHPLSYLIKENNFHLAHAFFCNYIIVEQVVFSSNEFYNTSSTCPFPIILVLYKRKENEGLTYDKVYKYTFRTIENKSFSLKDYDYIGEVIKKYPNKKQGEPDIKFYTLRDLNALSRSRTFIEKEGKNAVHIDIDKLKYYAYVDCVKEYIKKNGFPYYMGNFDIPYNKEEFSKIEGSVLALCMNRYKRIFKEYKNIPLPKDKDIKAVNEYIKKIFS